ncbi:MAG: putative toxin-antitoxin system toxin component, PIN family [Patescibacteria group bacterium]
MRIRNNKVVLDTNIIVSALLFGGNPRHILTLVISKHLVAFTSPILLAELFETLSKKFRFPKSDLTILEKQMNKYFVVVQPTKKITVLKDDPDNRLLELAIECSCPVIITGDKELLKLKQYKATRIFSPTEWIGIIK